MAATLAHLYRFPVKGLRGDPLDAATLAAGEGLPNDRRFAFARGDTRMDPAAPRWLPKQRFVMLMRDTGLARVACSVDTQAETIELTTPGRPRCAASWATPDGRQRLETWANDVLGPRDEGPVRLVEAGETSFTDVPQNCLSLINLESVRELELHMARALDPLRFRANLYVAGLSPWQEFDWVGQEIRIGEVTLRIPSRIPRCAATSVNPDTGERDANVVKGLRAAYGHYDMGIYAEVVCGGSVTVGDAVTPPDRPRARSWAGHWLRFFGFLARAAPIVLGRR